jgi:mevalonate kinase
MTSGVHGLNRDVDRLRIAMTANDEVAAAAAQADATNLQAQARYRMNRKASSPMMPAFMVSAPGKVIVFGEHAVVHGKVSSPVSLACGFYVHGQTHD